MAKQRLHGPDIGPRFRTGKRPVSATPAAARLLPQAIAADLAARGRVGFKPAGDTRTMADAALHIGLAREILGEGAVTPTRFRIGASGLLDDLEGVLGGGPRTSTGSAS